jgi:thiamine pyrophosphate-dependent acetolactate synthase large subunit-like protein
MRRKEAVKNIMDGITDELVVVTTGYLSRDVYAIKERPQNFYMCGSMGNAYGIGFGIALNSRKPVVVISGDGAVLMSLGSLVLGNHFKLPNLTHYILDNGCYGSTGGQPTCFEALDISPFFRTIHIKIDYDDEPSPRIPLSPEEITKRFMQADLA